MWKLYVGSMVRHAVSSLGAVLATYGFLVTEKQEEALSGLALAAGAQVWSLVQKWRSK